MSSCRRQSWKRGSSELERNKQKAKKANRDSEAASGVTRRTLKKDVADATLGLAIGSYAGEFMLMFRF